MQWRDGLLILLSLLLGPPIASLGTLIGISVGHEGLGALAAFDVEFFTGTILFAYVLGWFPAVATGGINAVASRVVAPDWRPLLALPIGALPFLALLGWIAQGESGDYDLNGLFGLAMGGALASLVTVTIVEIFGPKLRRED